MDRKSLERYLKTHYPSIYSFAFALVPEEVQARQIALDALQLVLNEDKSFSNDMVFTMPEDAERVQQELISRYFRSVYRLGLKRFDHLKNGIEIKVDRSEGSFYALGVQERAILFLKSRLKFNLDEIEFIMEVDRYQVLLLLNQSREYLVRNKEGRSFATLELIGT